jgi:dUTP pyrophosphatase
MTERVAKFEQISLKQWEEEGLNENDYEKIILPKRGTSKAAGYDFITPFPLKLLPGESTVVNTGIRAKIKDGWVLALFPRSGLGFKYKTRLANTCGIIDADYYEALNEGHIKVKLCNEGNATLELEAGKAFCQGIFLPFGITEDDEADGVRTGGFGSTGK